MERIAQIIQTFTPKRAYRALTHPYHYLLALLSAIVYGFPSRKLFVIGVTGTKGKTSTTEIINAVLEEAGYATALSNTIRFKIGNDSHPNRHKMTMPGRFFLQRFFRDALRAGCRYAILEMTSEGVLQYRHKWIALDMLVFTNIAPEHIEAHGSFEKYLEAKLKLRDLLRASPKQPKWVIANADDKHAPEFSDVESAKKLTFSLKDAEPFALSSRGLLITVRGESIHSPLMGEFNIYNLLAALAVAESQQIPLPTTKRALERFGRIAGRLERIEEGQPFALVVDYAHTPESLEGLYRTFKETHQKSRLICVLGNTGGGRDRWKRPLMGGIADRYCNTIMLTNEDPYDEDPRAIVEEMARGIKKHKVQIIMDRRAAIREALSRTRKNDVVLITGKGTDPYIMGPRGSKIPWSDAAVAREELARLSDAFRKKHVA